MTNLPQLALFEDPGELPAPEPQAERWETSPQPCPICGYQETSGWMVRINHGVGPDGYNRWPNGEHPNYGTQCLAQNLITGHLRRTAGTDDPHLSAYIERGRALGLDAGHHLSRPRLPALFVQVRVPLAGIEHHPVEVRLALRLGGAVQALVRLLAAQLAVPVEQRAVLALALVILPVFHVPHRAFGLRHTAGVAGLDH